MVEQQRIVIVERQRPLTSIGPTRELYHLPDGAVLSETEFQPIRCGGGISLPSHPQKVARSMVCADCLAGRTTT